MKREEIVGQDELLNIIDKMIETDNVPHFCILAGPIGSGKKLLVSYLADKLDAMLYLRPETPMTTMEYVRDIISQAYSQTEPTIYVISHSESSKVNVANALLKITEEPPRYAYFVLLCEQLRLIPKTLKSRCYSMKLKPYSEDELKAIALNYYGQIDDIVMNAIKISTTPGQLINQIKATKNAEELMTFTNKVVDNIGKVSDANMFKIADSIAFKDEDSGFSLNTFWVTFSTACLQKAKTINNSKRNMYFKWVRITGEYREKLRISVLNKRSLFDLWLVEIKNTYDTYN